MSSSDMTYNNRSMSGRATMWERQCKNALPHVLSRGIRRANCNDVSNFIAKESDGPCWRYSAGAFSCSSMPSLPPSTHQLSAIKRQDLFTWQTGKVHEQNDWIALLRMGEL